MPAPVQRPIELILARNLLSSISTAAFLVARAGEIIFYNDAAAELLGRRFEETGAMAVEQWTSLFGPFDEDGNALPFDEIELTQALRGNKPAHSNFYLRDASGQHHQIAASGFPIVGGQGFHGAIVVFWPLGEDGQ
jgi:PAS domain-containing protein